ncbi:MAG: endonuclease, partial [Aeromicrobium sp.]|nr:endonuclease [Aeromicrobium sp.]
MSSPEHDVLVHPVARCAAEVEAILADVADVPVDWMDAADRAAGLLKLARIGEMVGALELRLLAGAGDLALDQGARDGGVWMAEHTRTDIGPRQRDLLLADALTSRWHLLGAAVGRGEVNRAQARVIVAALDALDAPTVGHDVMGMAEEHLVGLAARFAPKQLRVLGRRILDLVAPEVGERHEARALEAEEERAWETTSLTLRPCGDGRTRIEAVLPDAVAHRLSTYLEAFMSP